jgi:two-component system cell cycle response regulator DivK
MAGAGAGRYVGAPTPSILSGAPGILATILLADDNADNLDIYQAILEHHGYTVVLAANGEAAVSEARVHRPELIFMDVSMPVMDGLEATRLLKADPATAAIRVIALTAHAMAEDRERALAAGCDGYLAKPLDPQALLGEVRKLLA